MIAMKVRAALLESLHWAALALFVAGWLLVAPVWWEVLRFVASEPGGGQVLFTVAGVLFVIRHWMRRRTRTRNAAPLGQRTPQETQHTARHEAAHAVVAWSLGAHVAEISTEAVGASRGRCSLATRPERPLVDEAWLMLRVCLASTVVEDRDRRRERGGCSSDLTQALTHAATILATGRRPDGYTAELTLDALIVGATEQARAIVDRHEQLLEAVAERVTGVTWRDPDLSAMDRQLRAPELVTA